MLDANLNQSLHKFTPMHNLYTPEPSLEIIENNALRGIGAIETIAIKEGKPLNLESHIERIGEAFVFFDIDNQDPLIANIINAGLAQFLELGNNGLLRIYLPYSPTSINPIFKFTYHSVPLVHKISSLEFKELTYKPGHTFKHMSRLVYHVPNHNATTLFYDDREFLCEAQYHSLLFSKGGFCFTPAWPALAIPSTAIAGIEKQGIKIYQRYIKKEDFENFDWVLLINSGSYCPIYNNTETHLTEFIENLRIFRH